MMSPEFYCLECIVAMYLVDALRAPVAEGHLSAFEIDPWAKALANEENP